jgi:hypothetical protein
VNKVNPIYLLAFFIFVALLMIYQNSKMQTKIIQTARESVEIEQDGSYIQGLKTRWKDSKTMQKRLDTVLSRFSKQITSKENKRNVYTIKADSLDATQADKLINALLNEALVVQKLSLEKTSKTAVSMLVEIAL